MKKHKLKASYSEAALENIFAKIFEPLRFPTEVCRWMQEALREHHKESSDESSRRMSALQSRYTMLDRYMNEAYEDKLDRKLSEEIGERGMRSGRLREARSAVNSALWPE